MYVLCRKWAVPFLDRYGLMLAGWVAVAPIGITGWGGPWEYTHKQVCALGYNITGV